MGSMVRNNSFSIFDGQITGVFGLVGSGRTETFKIVAGIYKRDFLRGGEIEFDGKSGALQRARPCGPGRHRLCHGGPQARGLLRDHVDCRELLFGTARRRPYPLQPSSPSREMREIAADWSRRLDVKAINDNARVVELSGGNQQKVVIGKGLAAEAETRDLRRADARRRRWRHR